MSSNATAISDIDAIQTAFFYYIGVISTAFAGIKLAIHAIRNLWVESVDVIEDTDELAHLIVSDTKRIYHGDDPRKHL